MCLDNTVAPASITLTLYIPEFKVVSLAEKNNAECYQYAMFQMWPTFKTHHLVRFPLPSPAMKSRQI